jgi:hypothetical protein
MLHTVDTRCTQLLQDGNMFGKALYYYVSKSENKPLEIQKEPGVYALLQLIEFVFDMLYDCGMSVLYRVYIKVRDRRDFEFEIAKEWHECVLSHVPCKQCLVIDIDTKVHEKYNKWVHCLWLITHIHQVENERSRGQKCCSISPEHTELYRISFVFVFEELERLYTDIARAQYSVLP